MLDLTPYYNLVENSLQMMQIDAEKVHSEKEGQWDFQYGSAHVWIDIFAVSQTNYGYLQVMSPIATIPPKQREAFFREALEINHQLYGVAFTIFNEILYIKMIREVQNLTLEETLAMIQRIGIYADEYDGMFAQKYGLAK